MWDDSAVDELKYSLMKRIKSNDKRQFNCRARKNFLNIFYIIIFNKIHFYQLKLLFLLFFFC